MKSNVISIYIAYTKGAVLDYTDCYSTELSIPLSKEDKKDIIDSLLIDLAQFYYHMGMVKIIDMQDGGFHLVIKVTCYNNNDQVERGFSKRIRQAVAKIKIFDGFHLEEKTQYDINRLLINYKRHKEKDTIYEITLNDLEWHMA